MSPNFFAQSLSLVNKCTHVTLFHIDLYFNPFAVRIYQNRCLHLSKFKTSINPHILVYGLILNLVLSVNQRLNANLF